MCFFYPIIQLKVNFVSVCNCQLHPFSTEVTNSHRRLQLQVHYTIHTTNVEIHRRVEEHIGKYNTLLEIVQTRKHKLFRPGESVSVVLPKRTD